MLYWLKIIKPIDNSTKLLTTERSLEQKSCRNESTDDAEKIMNSDNDYESSKTGAKTLSCMNFSG